MPAWPDCAKDGTTFPVEISLSPLATRTGPLTIAVVRDITQARQLEELAGLARAAAAAEKAYRDRELLDTTVTRLLRAGLSLHSAASQAPGPAADAIQDATAQLDDAIRDIHDTTLTTDTTDTTEPRALTRAGGLDDSSGQGKTR